MLYLNEYDVQNAIRRFRGNPGQDDPTPNLWTAAAILDNLMVWTNQNSDGWGYWRKPVQAARRLQELIQDGNARLWRGDATDCSRADLLRSLTPIKAFLSRQGADPITVLGLDTAARLERL